MRNRSHTTNLGDSIEAGLPNITGSTDGTKCCCSASTGPFALAEFSGASGALSAEDDPAPTPNCHNKTVKDNVHYNGYSEAGALTSKTVDWPTYNNTNFTTLKLDASRSNGIYGKSSTVQPPAICVIFWKRTA